MRHVTPSASLTKRMQPWRRWRWRHLPPVWLALAAAGVLLLLAPLPAAAKSAEGAAEALERELLVSFQATVPCWHRLKLAPSLSGQPSWHPAAQLHHCQWDGVACCTIREKLAADEGPVLRRRAVCSVRLAATPAGAPSAAASHGGPLAVPPPGPEVACDSAAAASIAPLLGLDWLQELSLDGIPVSAASLAGLLDSPPRGERLWILSLRRAALHVPLPPRLLQLPQLRVLDLSHSGVSGPLPPSRPCSLEEIDLAGNPVTGSIPAAWLADCMTGGSGSRGRPAFFPPLLLNLSRSGVNGQLPPLPLVGADRVGMSRVGVLDVSHTEVGGTLPQTWGGNSPHVRLLDLSHAGFRGTIPASWWATPHLLRFQAVEQEPGANPTSLTLLQGNKLHGTVTLAQAAALVNWTDAEDVKGLDLERQRTVAELENAVLRHQPLEGMGPYMLHAGRRDLRLHAMLLARGSHAALWPGNEGLCVEMSGELTWGRLEAARYPELQEHACSGWPRSAAGARALSLVLPLAAAAAGAAAVLAGLAAARKLRQRRRKRGYASVPAELGPTESSSASSEASQARPRPRRELELAARAVEQAQVGASRLGADASHAPQPQGGPPPDSLGSGGADDVAVLVGGEGPLMPPLLPITSLSFPRHDGQPLALGASGTTKVMLGRLEGVGEVAVKALHVSPQQLEHARREVALLKRCANRSPHVVAVHGLCYAHPFLLVVTELCGGGDLQSVLHMPELRWHALGARVALDISRGVAFMHSQGVVWADCKPGNVLLTAGFRAKVTDLGASRLLRGHSTAQVAGTHAYAAPEQLLNGRVSLASDVFSLGLVIQDICSGEPPAGPGQQRRALLPGVDCPAAVAGLLGLCLARDPAQRPTAEEVAEALQQYVPGSSGGGGLDAAPN